MAIAPTSPEILEQWLADHVEWQVEHGKLRRSFRFDNFVTAFGFMAKVALLAEKQDHHPEWFNVYGRVDIALVTHDVNAISERDLMLADAIEGLV
jgi:Pterin-4a-carbinolamine dehydratase